MKKLAFFLTIFASIILAANCANAAHRAGSPGPNTSCPFPLDGGCAAAPTNASFQISSAQFQTDAQQSIPFGQVWAIGNHPWNWNQAGIDYPIGQITPDASLNNPLTSPPATCGQFQTIFMRCNFTAPATIAHYLFNDYLVSSPNGQPILLQDNHFKIGFNACGGTGEVINSFGPLDAENNTFELDQTVCSVHASIFGQSFDPGLTVNSTGTANVSGGTLTYISTPTGNVHKSQYIHCSSGCTGYIKITGGSGLNWTICQFSGLSCVTPSFGPFNGITVTTGPQEPGFLGLLGGDNITAHYNVGFLGPDFGAEGACTDTDVSYNYYTFDIAISGHGNFIQNQVNPPQSPCTIANYKIHHNTIVLSKYGAGGVGNGSTTRTIGTFLTGPSSVQIVGAQTIFSKVVFDSNVIVANLPAGNSGGTTATYNVGTLNQGPSNGTSPWANVTATLTTGDLNITAINSGLYPIVPQMYLRCPTSGFCFDTASGGLPVQVIVQTAATTIQGGATFTGTIGWTASGTFTGSKQIILSGVVGTVSNGDTISGTGVTTTPTTIVSQASGTTGKDGTYNISANVTSSGATITGVSNQLLIDTGSVIGTVVHGQTFDKTGSLFALSVSGLTVTLSGQINVPNTSFTVANGANITASASGTTLNITPGSIVGTVAIGQFFSTALPSGTKIVSGSGNTWTLNQSVGTVASVAMTTGAGGFIGHYSITNTTYTGSVSNEAMFLYAGQAVEQDMTNNYLDNIGALGPYSLDTYFMPQPTNILTGNFNLETGAPCNSTC